MEVILIKDMENLGYANDYRDRKARLCEQLPDSPGVTQRLPPHPPRRCSPRTSASAPTSDAKIPADAQALAETIANLPLTLAVKAEEGKLFGTVTATDLAEALAAKGIELDRKLIAVEGIKDRRRVRSDRQTPQGGQGRHQILGYRRRIIRRRLQGFCPCNSSHEKRESQRLSFLFRQYSVPIFVSPNSETGTPRVLPTRIPDCSIPPDSPPRGAAARPADRDGGAARSRNAARAPRRRRSPARRPPYRHAACPAPSRPKWRSPAQAAGRYRCSTPWPARS